MSKFAFIVEMKRECLLESKKEAAWKLGYTEQHYRNIINGKKNVTLTAIKAAKNAYGLSDKEVSEILDDLRESRKKNILD